MQRFLLVVVGVVSACSARARVGPVAGYDRGYLLARASQEGCGRRAGCCARLEGQVKAAGNAADAAAAIDALAISCPAQREAARAALNRSTGGGQAPAEGNVHVQYALSLGPDDRIFWAGAFVDGQYAPGARLEPGRHNLEVEVHVTPQAGPDREQLYELRASKPFELENDQTHILTVRVVRRDGGGDAITLDVDDLPMKLAAPNPARPRATGGSAGSVPPSELGAFSTLVKVCMAPSGAATVEPLGPLHPRHAAAAIAAVQSARRSPGKCANESVTLR